MSPILRCWTGFAALGAGLLHLGLVVGEPAPVAAAVAIGGLAETAWAVAAFARDRPPLPRIAPVLALCPGVLWLALMLVGARGVALPPYPLATATALDLAVALLLAVDARRRPRRGGVGHPLLALGGIALGALALALVTIPALAATPAGGAAPLYLHGGHAH